MLPYYKPKVFVTYLFALSLDKRKENVLENSFFFIEEITRKTPKEENEVFFSFRIKTKAATTGVL